MIDFRVQPPGFPQGIYDVSFAVYQLIPALNSSKLKHMRKTPAHFKAAMEEPRKPITPQQQKTFDLGSCFDLRVLEGPGALREKTAINPPGLHKNSNDYKAWAAENAGRMLIDQELFDRAVNMAQRASNKKQFSTIFSAGQAHTVLVWQCRETGLWCKGELDWITDNGLLVDLKSTADAGFWFFQRNARRLGYINQMAHYLDGLTTVTGIRHTEGVFAAVEVDPPHESHIFKPSTGQLIDAEAENERRKGVLLNCLISGEWPGYPDEILSLDSGQYEYEDLEDEENEYTEGI